MLTEKQIGVLVWIKDGCSGDDSEPDYSRRITARALHRRGLVVVAGHGASWTAAITRAGRAWLEKHPNDAASGDGGGGEAEDLIRRVLAAGGALVVGDSYEVKSAHEDLVRATNHSPERPTGWRLELKNAGSWSSPLYEVVLIRHFDDLVEPAPVPVPAHVGRYHPAVKAFLADRDRQMVSGEHVGRAARVLQALADEAPRRGIDTLAPEQVTRPLDAYQEREVRRAHLVLGAPAGFYSVRVRELSAHSDQRMRPRPWGLSSKRAAWLDRRDTEFLSTGELELIVEGPGMGYSGDRFRDSRTITLEERLPRIFRKIEIHRLEAELREQEREQEAADRRRRWETAMAEARARYAEQARWDAFAQRSNNWDAVRRHREFLAAARDAVGRVEGPSRSDLEAHLDFAECRLDELDPVKNPDRLLAVIPDPKPDDLKPYLRGWSPHGPDAAGW